MILVKRLRTLYKTSECDKKHQICPHFCFKNIHEPPVSVLFSVLCVKNSVAKFQYSDFNWKVFCGQRANLVVDSRGNFSIGKV